MFRTLGRSVWTPLLKCLQVGKNPGGVGKTPDQLGKTPGGWENPRLAHFWNLFKKSGVQAQTPDHNCTVRPWPCPGPPDCICYKGVKGLFRSVGTQHGPTTRVLLLVSGCGSSLFYAPNSRPTSIFYAPNSHFLCFKF